MKNNVRLIKITMSNLNNVNEEQCQINLNKKTH
jgi:hypothetical protein